MHPTANRAPLRSTCTAAVVLPYSEFVIRWNSINAPLLNDLITVNFTTLNLFCLLLNLHKSEPVLKSFSMKYKK